MPHSSKDADTAPVTVTEDMNSFTLINSAVTAVVSKRSGGLTSLTYGGKEMLNSVSGHDSGYWSHDTSRSTDRSSRISIDPNTNGGIAGEVSIKGFCHGAPLGAGPGGSVIADIEIRCCVVQGVPGVYTYSILTHPSDYPATAIGEARYAVKLNDTLFDWMIVDKNRSKLMITAHDWNHGTPLNMKEVRRMKTGLFNGQVEHKYDYCALQFDTPAFGWCSSTQGIGCWIINPSCEYLSGGPTKMELTAHRDATFTDSLTAPAPPVILNYWRGSHYGGSVCEMPEGDSWTKVVGPFLLYCNSGSSPDTMHQDAMAQADMEAKRWPYRWVQDTDYPLSDQRGSVSGQIFLHDPNDPAVEMSDLLVGLSHPDYFVRDELVDWQHDAKFYQFWVHADAEGRFMIPHVRPGNYTLHAFAAGVLGEYAHTEIAVQPGQSLELETLVWTPVRYGRELWSIGIPDRSAGKYLHGDDYWHWGLYLKYPEDFPQDVNYIVGTSDFRKDWNYAQVPRAQPGDVNAACPGFPTVWTVSFDLADMPHGWAILRLAISGAAAIPLTIIINDHPVAIAHLKYNSGINRDNVRGDWMEIDVLFNAERMHAGSNLLKLSIPGGNVMDGVEYDYIRLELCEEAVPPALPAASTARVEAIV